MKTSKMKKLSLIKRWSLYASATQTNKCTGKSSYYHLAHNKKEKKYKLSNHTRQDT